MLSPAMHVRVIAFGVLKDWLGGPASSVELPEGARVEELLAGLKGRLPEGAVRSIAVSVNAEYASADHLLHEGDEVGLLPPVSGGTRHGAGNGVYTALTREAIDAKGLVEQAKRPEDGGVVVFDGIVRDNSRGRRTLYLDYEAYEEMAERELQKLAVEARARFGVRGVTIVHRLGRLEIGETSVLIVVASGHRAEAFEACRWLIDTLKKQVPVWKKETFEDGAVWADGEPFPEELRAAGAEGADGK